MLKTTMAILVAIATVATSCGGSETPDATTETLARSLLDTGAGYIFGYENLSDRILDSDAVVVGTVIDFQLAGSEDSNDGSGEAVQYMSVLIRVQDVIHSTQQVADLLVVETFLPGLMTIEEVKKTLPEQNRGFYFLFNVVAIESRLGQSVNPDPDVWIFQNGDAIVLDPGVGRAESPARVGTGIAETPEAFEDLLAEVRSTAAGLQGREQPSFPIGLSEQRRVDEGG